jgi:hypothetical protein
VGREARRIMPAMKRYDEMKLFRRMLMVITPVGVAIGLYEAWDLAGGLVVLMALQILVLAIAGVALVRVIRREQKSSRK